MKFALIGSTVFFCACSTVPTDAQRGDGLEPSGPMSPAAESPEARPETYVSLFAGLRTLHDDDWDPVEDQGAIGFQLAYAPLEWPVGMEIGLMHSSDDDSDSGDPEVRITDIYAGVNKTFDFDRMHPYVGGGLALVSGKSEDSGGSSDSDRSLAGYIHAGILFDVSRVVSLGLDARHLFGSDLELSGDGIDADYSQLALVLAFWR
jgi:opacity protein-like surface antigen